MEVAHEQRFHFKDGSSAGNLEELKEKIEVISYDEFYEHVNDEKNDFANWVEHVLGNSELANQLNNVTSIVEIVELLNDAIDPEGVARAESALDEQGLEHIQAKIEESLGQPPEAEEPAEPIEQLPEGDIAIDEPGEEVNLPAAEEMTPEQTQGEPVVSEESAHVPVTEKVEPHPGEKHFVVKHFVYGFLAGVLVSVVVLQMISLLQ